MQVNYSGLLNHFDVIEVLAKDQLKFIKRVLSWMKKDVVERENSLGRRKKIFNHYQAKVQKQKSGLMAIWNKGTPDTLMAQIGNLTCAEEDMVLKMKNRCVVPMEEYFSTYVKTLNGLIADEAKHMKVLGALKQKEDKEKREAIKSFESYLAAKGKSKEQSMYSKVLKAFEEYSANRDARNQKRKNYWIEHFPPLFEALWTLEIAAQEKMESFLNTFTEFLTLGLPQMESSAKIMTDALRNYNAVEFQKSSIEALVATHGWSDSPPEEAWLLPCKPDEIATFVPGAYTPAADLPVPSPLLSSQAARPPGGVSAGQPTTLGSSPVAGPRAPPLRQAAPPGEDNTGHKGFKLPPPIQSLGGAKSPPPIKSPVKPPAKPVKPAQPAKPAPPTKPTKSQEPFPPSSAGSSTELTGLARAEGRVRRNTTFGDTQKLAIAIWDYVSEVPGDLQMSTGDQIEITGTEAGAGPPNKDLPWWNSWQEGTYTPPKTWWAGTNMRTGAQGIFPCNYVGPARTTALSSFSASSQAQPKAVALFDYQSQGDSCVGFKKGYTIELADTSHESWWRGTVVESGETGFFPAKYVKTA